MKKFITKFETVEAEIVGEISLKNNSSEKEPMWKILSEGNIVQYIVDSVFKEKFIPKEILVVTDKEVFESEIQLLKEQIKNLKTEYEMILMQKKEVEKQHGKLLVLAKETFLKIKQDIYDIRSKSTQEYAALEQTIIRITAALV